MHYLPKTIIKIMHVIHPNALVNSPSAYQAIDLVLKRDVKDTQNKKQVADIHVVHRGFCWLGYKYDSIKETDSCMWIEEETHMSLADIFVKPIARACCLPSAIIA